MTPVQLHTSQFYAFAISKAIRKHQPSLRWQKPRAPRASEGKIHKIETSPDIPGHRKADLSAPKERHCHRVSFPHHNFS